MDEQRQKDFLIQVLQVIHDSDANPQAIYPLLEENTNILDYGFADLLHRWATAALAKADLNTAQGLVGAINDFSRLILGFSSGDRASSIEIAIEGYKIVTIVATREAFPHEWAIIQANLGNAYSDRLRGNQGENREMAIQYYCSALEIFTQNTFPEQWGIIQKNLGDVYVDWFLSDKDNHLEAAIAHYLCALKVITLEVYPERWADIQLNLGAAYCQRIQGESSKNIETAINSYQAALQVYIREIFPEHWADLQNNLGVAYRDRLLGEQAENLDIAISYLSATLEIYTREDFPDRWAIAQLNLGNVYHRRIRGTPVENFEIAIKHYSTALQVYSREDFPEQWALIQNNLGSLYYDYKQGETGENFETAIRCFLFALEISNLKTLPEQWAQIQNNLGNIYLDRIQGDQSENLEAAIQHYKAALEVYTRDAFPKDWADIQSSLGVIYNLRRCGNRSENSSLAIDFHLAGLEVLKRETTPHVWAGAQNNLGIAYQDTYKFDAAYTAFQATVDVVESLREEIVTGSDRSEDKQKLAERWNILYQRMVVVCLNLDYYDQAIEYAERSKTRNLVELILSRDRHTIFPAEVVTQLDGLRDEIASGQYELQNATAEDPTTLAQHLQLRQQRNELQDRYLPIGSGFQFEQFRSSLSDRTAIVEFYLTTDKLLVFIITNQTQQPIVLSPDLINQNKLAKWANSYLKAYRNKKSHWQHRLTTRLNLLAKILRIDEIIQQIPTEFDKLILIPHRYLHLLPLHALPLAGDSSLFDRFHAGVSYAPSCQLLQLTQTRHRPEFDRLFAVQNPTGDLSYTDLEVETIQSYFSNSNLLKQLTATKEAVDDTTLTTIHCAHFSCHGYFNGTEPRKSALILANAELSSPPTQPDSKNYLSLESGVVLDLNKCLTLDSIFTLNLEQCRLVTLSACETGLIDFRNTSDEYIGLPSGFLYAGAASVVSSLWMVNDLSTAFLMIRFYQNLHKGLRVALALNQAQLWLKDLTRRDLEIWIEESQVALKPAVKMNLRRRLYKLDDDAKPFKSPFYWAAFCAIGQ
jgi:CHAT domain-containing protein